MVYVSVHPLEGGLIEPIPGVEVHKKALVVHEDYLGYDVTGEVEVTDQGKAEVVQLTVKKRPDGERVTGSALRSIAVQGIVRSFVKHELRWKLGLSPGETVEVSAHGLLTTEEARRLKRQGPTPETIEQVALVYRLAEFLEDAPTKAVEDTFEISRSTAGAWIGRARSAGLIPAVKDGSDGTTE
ncbi:hypothetical protein [Rhodococcus sp. Chr-9]|uniref:hypothetical protein n=1 Tax=Rhodococcus sp. Chr-9 TaxID=713612 RepID=UPI001269F662|nr:hypothetical protein [Rhodococcus sp. Chr-9]